jgi:hypothetical protein
LYYSGENYNELPSRWRGFLLDHRLLYMVAVAPGPRTAESRLRKRYREETARLEERARTAKLSADELADLGALYVRLGEAAKAVALLRSAQRDHPNHFHLLANLGTACQVQGDLDQAAAYLQQAVRLAPGRFQEAEEYQLKLVRARLQRPPRTDRVDGPDNLFGIRFVADDGNYQARKIGDAEWKKLPSRAVAIVQQLSLWLPQDGRLLWQLAELANATGDVQTAAAIMDGCVTQYGLSNPELRRHRQILRAAADQQARAADAGPHNQHARALKARSQRPLASHADEAALPPISDTGVNNLPWELLSQTQVNAKFHPIFAKYLRELDGKQVALNGYIQPLGEGADLAAFMLIEYPVGCWYCEMPDVIGIVTVELTPGRTVTHRRDQVRVIGRLQLNTGNPEDFLYAIRQARVTGID